MKRFVIICGIAVAVATLFYMTREEWFSFMVIGRLPFTGIILPAAMMMGFWMIDDHCTSMHYLGQVDQRHVLEQH